MADALLGKGAGLKIRASRDNFERRGARAWERESVKSVVLSGCGRDRTFSDSAGGDKRSEGERDGMSEEELDGEISDEEVCSILESSLREVEDGITETSTYVVR